MADYKKSKTETAVNKQDHGKKQTNEAITDFGEGDRTGSLSVTNSVSPPPKKKGK